MSKDLPTGSPNGTSTLINRRTLLRSAAVAGAATGVVFRMTDAKAEAWEEGDLQCRPQFEEKDPDNYKINDSLLVDFMAVSETLTGISPLDRTIGVQYLERYARHPDLQNLLPPLIKAHKEAARGTSTPQDVLNAFEKTIARDPSIVGPAAEQLVYLWYVSAFFLPIDHNANPRSWIYGSIEQYQRSLLWSVVQAHPPMTRGGPYGHWARGPHAVDRSNKLQTTFLR
jgi:hypothetical protein